MDNGSSLGNNRRSHPAWLNFSGGLLVCCLVFSGWLLSGCGGGSSRPNLLLISIDTTRADHLGAYGYERAHTPSIDALAAEGFLFRRHLTPVPLTLPSHTSLMTGRFPPTHTVHDNGTFIVPETEQTLAEVLRQEGYRTSAFVGAFPLAAQFGLDQGFDLYEDTFHASEADRQRQMQDIFFDERRAGAVVDAAISYHEERKAGPFFTFLHVFDPHQPQMPPAPYDIEYRDRPYDGEIAYVDAQLGRFFDFLKERGEWDNTLVVLTADHGEGLGEHGELTHAILLHQATLHIPLILRGPGIPHGETREWTVSTQLFATLLERLGIQVPAMEKSPSHSLWPIVEAGGQAPGSYPRFTAFFETIAPLTTQGWSQLTAFMREDWRLVHGPTPELYQLDRDPGEQTNLFTAEPEVGEGLSAGLQTFLADFETKSVSESMGTIDEETRERLEALGYLQAGGEELGSLSDLLDVEGRINPRDRVVDVAIFSEAKSAMARRNWALAERLWQEIKRRSPDNTTAYRGLAQLYGMTEDWEAAFAAIDQALVRRPTANDMLRMKGELLIQIGRYQEGLDHLLALPSDSVQASTWIGRAYQGLDQGEEAMAWFRKGLELQPTHRWLRLYTANQLANDGSVAEAEAMYREIVANAPYFSLVFYNYGKLLFDQGRYDHARGLFERAATLDPEHEMTRQALQRLAQRRSEELGESR